MGDPDEEKLVDDPGRGGGMTKEGGHEGGVAA